jgi:hypothetical protein
VDLSSLCEAIVDFYALESFRKLGFYDVVFFLNIFGITKEMVLGLIEEGFSITSLLRSVSDLMADCLESKSDSYYLYFWF